MTANVPSPPSFKPADSATTGLYLIEVKGLLPVYCQYEKAAELYLYCTQAYENGRADGRAESAADNQPGDKRK